MWHSYMIFIVLYIAPGSERAMQTLQSMNLNSGANNFCKVLEDLAKEKKFDVRYLELKEKSYSGGFKMLMLCMRI